MSEATPIARRNVAIKLVSSNIDISRHAHDAYERSAVMIKYGSDAPGQEYTTDMEHLVVTVDGHRTKMAVEGCDFLRNDIARHAFVVLTCRINRKGLRGQLYVLMSAQHDWRQDHPRPQPYFRDLSWHVHPSSIIIRPKDVDVFDFNAWQLISAITDETATEIKTFDWL